MLIFAPLPKIKRVGNQRNFLIGIDSSEFFLTIIDDFLTLFASGLCEGFHHPCLLFNIFFASFLVPKKLKKGQKFNPKLRVFEFALKYL